MGGLLPCELSTLTQLAYCQLSQFNSEWGCQHLSPPPSPPPPSPPPPSPSPPPLPPPSPPVTGCTNSFALNYLVNAVVDDGTCIVGGCTDSRASNYDPTA